MSAPSDEMLVHHVRAGDKTAYGQLYDRYAALIRAVCYDTTHNRADAQDLAQDVFLRAYNKLGQLRDPSRFGKWLVAIARFRSREWQRRRARDPVGHVSADLAELVVDDSRHDGRIERLRDTIPMLPEKERLALHVFYLQGKSADDGCRIMDLSRSGFYRVLDRARNELKQRLIREQENVR